MSEPRGKPHGNPKVGKSRNGPLLPVSVWNSQESQCRTLPERPLIPIESEKDGEC